VEVGWGICWRCIRHGGLLPGDMGSVKAFVGKGGVGGAFVLDEGTAALRGGRLIGIWRVE